MEQRRRHYVAGRQSPPGHQQNAEGMASQPISPFRTSSGISPYGLGIFSQTFLDKQIVWGFGQDDGFSSLMLKVPEDDVTLVLLANNNLMSDPPRLINGDITYSLFALSFLKHFVFDMPGEVDFRNDYGPFYRQELFANAIAASLIGRADSAHSR